MILQPKDGRGRGLRGRAAGGDNTGQSTTSAAGKTFRQRDHILPGSGEAVRTPGEQRSLT